MENITDGASPITAASYPVQTADGTLLFDPTSADQVATLIDPTTNKGAKFTLMKVVASTNIVTVSGLMNSSTEVILSSLWDFVTVQSNGVKYVIIGSS